jgi:hypothetical protein
MSTDESVLNEIEVAATNIIDSIKKYRALLVEEKPISTNSAIVKCPYYKYASAGCPIFGGDCKPVPCKLQRALHQCVFSMMEYIQKDILLPDLQLPNPCTVRIKIDEKNVCLYVGPRDWQWDRESGKFIGAGMCIYNAAQQNLTGNNTPKTPPEGEIKRECSTCGRERYGTCDPSLCDTGYSGWIPA